MEALVYDTAATKRATNLSVNSCLLRRAKELKVNLSALLESALVQELRERETAQWMAENQAPIALYNELVRQAGVFSDGLRTL